MPDQNQSILALYQSLKVQQDALFAATSTTTDAKLANTLSNEYSEVTHRMILAQNLLFQNDSAALKQSVNAVNNSAGQLKIALTNLGRTADFLNAMTGYLTTVDTALDLAKKIAAA